MAGLYPLAYRVEVLENIFSLLFVTHEALAEVGSWDSGEEGGDEAGTRFANPDTPGMCSSFGDSLTPSAPLSPMDSTFKPFSPYLTMRQSTGVGSVNQAERNKAGRNLFSLTDSRLQEVLEEGLGQKVRNSGSMSNTSNTSTNSAYRIGFLANSYIVRDLLSVLKV